MDLLEKFEETSKKTSVSGLLSFDLVIIQVGYQYWYIKQFYDKKRKKINN